MSSLLKTASWVIREKATGEVLFETFEPKVVQALNTVRYEAVPILAYLQSLNGKQLPQQVSGNDGAGPEDYQARKRLFEIGNMVEGEVLTDEEARNLGEELRRISGICPHCQGEPLGDEPDPVSAEGGPYSCPKCAGIVVLPNLWKPAEAY